MVRPLPPLRDYQARAVEETRRLWESGLRRVCVVLPTGGGKTRLAVELTRDVPGCGGRQRVPVLWIAHRTELLGQAGAHLLKAGLDVGYISPALPSSPLAPIQIASVATLVARSNSRPRADLVVWDEAHHVAADTYAAVADHYGDALHLGLTATPQRSDGRPLGDYYDAIVAAAQYSELLKCGALVGCRVRRPPSYLGADLARAPLDEWQQFAAGMPTFAFAQDVRDAREQTEVFRAAGVAAACLTGETPAAERAGLLEDFRLGRITVLWNVYVLTEGVDVPQAACCLLARGCGNPGPYLQMVGRVLRPAPGKDTAILLDMPGASWLHGLPTCDREYSLSGRPIRAIGEDVKTCPECGALVSLPTPLCPECGFRFAQALQAESERPKIWNVELQWAVEAAGGDAAAVSDDSKRSEWRRLIRLIEDRGWSLWFARKEYEKLFSEKPPSPWMADIPLKVRNDEYARLKTLALSRGYKHGWILHRYKSLFGDLPERRNKNGS